MGNIGLSGSFVVGGIVLLTLIYIHFRFDDINQAQVINEFTESSMTSLADVLDYDFNKVGYRVSSNPKICSINDSSIVYLSDLDNNGSVDSVKYFTQRSNSMKYLVRRTTISNVKESKVAINSFIVQGYDSLNNLTVTTSIIKSLDVQVVIDNNAFRSDSTKNYGSYYRRKYFVRNK
ncbi:MAG: hypothetical protein Q8L04_18580 [Ignavibacteria bacterium]|nr:hypothetical protein [Ignavibacteria bacterium]